MFRLYDTAQREVAEITPARPGLLRMHADRPCPGRPAQLADLRTCVLTDLIRRNAERHGLSVIICQDAGGASDLTQADCAALSAAPPDLECGSPSAPGGDRVVIDVGVSGELEAGQRAGAAEGTAEPPAWHAQVRHWVRSAPVLTDRTMSAAGGTGPGASEPGGSGPGARDVPLAEVAARGLDPLAVRLAFLGQRYREELEVSWDLLADASAEVGRWRELVATWANEPSKPICAEYWSRFAGALNDDLDTPAALTALRALAADSEIPAGSKFETFAAADRVLGLELVSLVGRLPA